VCPALLIIFLASIALNTSLQDTVRAVTACDTYSISADTKKITVHCDTSTEAGKSYDGKVFTTNDGKNFSYTMKSCTTKLVLNSDKTAVNVSGKVYENSKCNTVTPRTNSVTTVSSQTGATPDGCSVDSCKGQQFNSAILSKACVTQESTSFSYGGGCQNTTTLISTIIKFLSAMVGIAVVAGIVTGGLIYASSDGNATKAQKGITTIVNSVIGLVLFLFVLALSNFLVPGGIFG
jgi:hypothetical protein